MWEFFWGNFAHGNVWENSLGCLSGSPFRIASLHLAFTIWAAEGNTRIQTQTDRQLLRSCTLSSTSWAKNNESLCTYKCILCCSCSNRCVDCFW